MSAPVLEIKGLSVSYRHIRALHNVDLKVEAGEIVALIGANGAGKTTTLLTVSGLLKADRGDIAYEGASIKGMKPQEIVRRGIIQAPEGRAILTTMTVRENLLLGAYSRKDRAEAAKDLDRVMDRFPILRERAGQSAGNLSGGEQQMLAIGRALMGKPKLLLLDEPSMGLAPLIVKEIFGIITEINASGAAILLVEQNARQALKIAHRAYAIETGRTVLSGSGPELLHDPRVVEAYLGG